MLAFDSANQSLSLQVTEKMSDTLTAIVIEGGAHHLDLRYTQ